MRKNFIITALAMCCTTAIISLSLAIYNMSYWKQRAETAESIVKEYNPYILDVLCETDEWEESK